MDSLQYLQNSSKVVKINNVKMEICIAAEFLPKTSDKNNMSTHLINLLFLLGGFHWH